MGRHFRGLLSVANYIQVKCLVFFFVPIFGPMGSRAGLQYRDLSVMPWAFNCFLWAALLNKSAEQSIGKING